MIRKEEKRYEKQYTNTHREHPVEHGAPCRPCACRRTGGRDTEGHWAESAIERWSGYGVVEGRGDGTFAPEAELSRAEMAQV